MIQEISLAFSKAKSEKRALLIGFITAGYPSKERSLEIAKAMVAGGVDLIEVGFPYSDPVMDGPVIQRAAEIALANGAKASEVLEVVSGVSKLEVPVVVMTYWNPIEKYGVNIFYTAPTAIRAFIRAGDDLPKARNLSSLQIGRAHV